LSLYWESFSVTEKNNCAIIMEYMGGGSLDMLLYSSTPITLLEVLQILLDVAMGMAHIHAENILHRDLAARNVLLTTERRAKIADFGFARFEMPNSSGSFRGAIRWMAPESLKYQTHSVYSDSWSYGILVYECMARQAPHKESNLPLKDLLIAIGHDFITPLLPPHTPIFLRDVGRKCWMREPTQRSTFHQIITTISENLDSFKTNTTEVPSPTKIM